MNLGGGGRLRSEWVGPLALTNARQPGSTGGEQVGIQATFHLPQRSHWHQSLVLNGGGWGFGVDVDIAEVRGAFEKVEILADRDR